MGRFHPTATMQVYEFEQQWNQFWRAPSKVKREAFGELTAMAHFRAAAMAHAATPYMFEMILLTMLVGIVRRVETLQTLRALPTDTSASAEVTPSFQAILRDAMGVLRQRLVKQKHELYTFARALRTEDQKALRALLLATQPNASSLVPAMKATNDVLVPFDDGAPASDELLLTSLVNTMRWIRRIEKSHEGDNAIVSNQEWSLLCTAP